MSKKTLYFAFVIGLFAIACNDGNLEVDTISFENSDVLSCTTNDTTATFLFKYSQKQALILNLPANILENKEKTVSGTIPTNFKLYYRTFSDAVTTNYFCNAYLLLPLMLLRKLKRQEVLLQLSHVPFIMKQQALCCVMTIK